MLELRDQWIIDILLKTYTWFEGVCDTPSTCHLVALFKKIKLKLFEFRKVFFQISIYGLDTKNQVWGFGSGIGGKLIISFLHFFSDFCSIWWFFKVERNEEIFQHNDFMIFYLKNHKIDQKLDTKWKKAIFKFPPKTQNLVFGIWSISTSLKNKL